MVEINYLRPLVEAQTIADDQRYADTEHDLIKVGVLATQALLYNAGAFKPDNPMTPMVIRLIVGYWLENRDNMGFDFKSTEHLPFSITAMINSLRYWGFDEDRGGADG